MHLQQLILPRHAFHFVTVVVEQVVGRRWPAARSTSPPSGSATAPTLHLPSATTAVNLPPARRRHPLIISPGATLKLNLCANVPDTEIPEVCSSLVKTVGYKMYYIGERQVRQPQRAHASPPDALLPCSRGRRCARILGSSSMATGPSSTAAILKSASGASAASPFTCAAAPFPSYPSEWSTALGRSIHLQFGNRSACRAATTSRI